MLVGKSVEEFKIDNRFVKIRYPKLEDAEDLQRYINVLIDENAYINKLTKVNRKEEIEFVTDLLERVENKKCTALVVEVNGEVMGLAEINKKMEAESHIGILGVFCKDIGNTSI
ncbi:MAG TPA: hypothetical protein EYP80_00900 [Candidatus Aenigmarchaeota archaeon]|nr:hypothetical protein [Candidatus Aenigmarchaeota archaeon]